MKTFVLVVLANYLLRALLAAGLFLPFAGVIQAAGVGQFPRGDRILFEGSGLYLVELLRLAGPELALLGRGSLKLVVPLLLVLLLARALTLSTLVQSQFDLEVVVGRALRMLPGFVLIAGVVLLAQVLTFGLFLWLGFGLAELFPATAERPADLTLWAVALLGLLVALVLGAIGELGRASMARGGESGLAALAHGLALCRRAPLALLSRWAGYGAAGIALVAAAAKLSELVDVSQDGAWRPACVFGLHQLVALALVALHTAWLVYALRAAHEPVESR